MSKKSQDSAYPVYVPLYKDQAVQNLLNRPPSAHAGLWYEKFCNRWDREKGYWKLEKQKVDWIHTITKQFEGKTGDKKKIAEAVLRFTKLVDQGKSGHLLYVKTASRFVTGMGHSNPVENGFTWHHLLGTAYLPGSSIKGMVRSWVREWEKIDSDKQELITRIFGPAESSYKQSVGTVIFFDALPVTPIQCDAEIMTVHYSEYYKNPTTHPPRDWENPNPIPFLTVAKEQPFIFGIAPRRASAAQDQKDAQKVIEWLKNALEWGGAGAKTAVGYGLFEVDAKRQGQWQEEQRLAKLSPLEREMETDGYSDQDESQFMESMKKWLDRLDSEELPMEQKSQIAQQLYNWYQQRRVEQWKKPNQKNKRKISIIQKYLPQK